MIACLLAACLLSANTVLAQDAIVSNSGTEFYVMFMANIVERMTDNDQMSLIVSNPDPSQTATIEARMPLMLDAGYATENILPLQSVVLPVPSAAMALMPGKGRQGIYITSNINVTVVAVNKQNFSTDSFLVFPDTSLSMSYIGACYKANIRTQIGIVGTRDNTTVAISLPELNSDAVPVSFAHGGKWYSNSLGAESTFYITLNKHETFLLTSRGDLTATLIRANRRVAVFSGNVRAKYDGISRDHLVEQLIPDYFWLTEWYTLPTPTRTSGDVYRVLSLDSAANVITVQLANGTTLPNLQIPSSKHFAELTIPTRQEAKFTCTKRCLVYQISYSADKEEFGDPSMFLASNPDEFGSFRYIYKTPVTSFGNNYDRTNLMVMSRSQVTLFSRLDGLGTVSTVSVNWRYITYLNMYVGEVAVNVGRTVYLYTTSSTPFVLWLFGHADRESYAHSLGFRIFSPECLGSGRDLMRLGDGIDNDCDGLIDEEPGPIDGVDNDADTRVDEDVGYAPGTLSSGREYVIMFMENTVEVNNNISLEVFIGGLQPANSSSTRVMVSYPVNDTYREVLDLFVSPKEVHKIELNSGLKQIGTGLQSKAIHIKADNDIVVYGINKEVYSADGFLALPVTTFGQEYYTMCYHPPTSHTEFAVVAVNDSTVVDITFPPITHTGEGLMVTYEGRTYTNGETLTVTMNALQTLQIQDDLQTGDLTGARIVSSHPVGVFSGNVRTFVTYRPSVTSGSRDHLVEQLPPVNSYGKKFAMFTTPERTVGDFFKIVASEDNTNITVCMRMSATSTFCNESNITLAGGHMEINRFESGYYIYIEADKPIMVVQITRSQTTSNGEPICDPPAPAGSNWLDNCAADPAMMLIAPLEQYSNDYTFLTPTIANPELYADYRFHWLMVIINKNETNGLILDGNTTVFSGATWVDIPNSPSSNHGLVATAIKLPFALHTLNHTKPDVLYMGLLYGVADRESYGFPIGLKLDDLRILCQQTESVVGDGVDNDCDGNIDEEICENGEDDDSDGRIDEDCYIVPENYAYLAVFMENQVEFPLEYPLRLYGASQQSQVVHVTYTDSISGVTYLKSQQVTNSGILNFGAPHTLMQRGSGKSNKGIRVTSSYPIDLFGSNEEKFSHDCFLVFPTNILGTEYYTIHQSPSYLPEEFAVTPVFNNTEVNVSVAFNLIGTAQMDRNNYNGGSQFSFTLNIGESVQIQARGSGMGGTRITSSSPIAVFSGNVRTMVDDLAGSLPSRDHLVEQLLPYDRWGTTYFAPSTPNRDYRDMYVFLSKNTQTVEIMTTSGTTSSINLQAGVPYSYPLQSGNGVYYRFTSTSGSRFQVVRLTWSQLSRHHPDKTDPSMLLMMPESLWKTRYSFALPLFSGGSEGGQYNHTVQIVVSTSKRGDIQLDGRNLTSSVTWNELGNSGYSMANLNLASAPRINLDGQGVKFMAYLYGAADRESYAMPCGVAIV